MKHPPQEPDYVPGRQVTLVGAGVVVAIAICALLAFGIDWYRSRQIGSPWRSAKGPPIPGEVNAMETRVFSAEAPGIEMNQRASQLLSTYSWVDRDRGIVRVPIQVAYELVIEQQLQPSQPGQQPQQGKQSPQQQEREQRQKQEQAQRQKQQQQQMQEQQEQLQKQQLAQPEQHRKPQPQSRPQEQPQAPLQSQPQPQSPSQPQLQSRPGGER